MTQTVFSVVSDEKTSAPASNNTPPEALLDSSFIKYIGELVCFQIGSVTSTDWPQKRGHKPTPLSGVIVNLTRPNRVVP